MLDPAELGRFCLQRSAAVYVAEIDGQGFIVGGNQTVQVSLQILPEDAALRLMSPRVFTLPSCSAVDDVCYEGRITLSDGYKTSIDLIGRIYCHGDRFTVLGEKDVGVVEDINRKMLALNDENMVLQRDLIKQQKVLENTLKKLKETQAHLVHSEKMSSLGQLVAGIAHEINNPIAYVYTNVFNHEELTRDILKALEKIETLAAAGPVSIDVINAVKAEFDTDYLIDDFPDLVHGCKDGLTRVKRIVEDLRTFSRLDESARQLVSIDECIESAVRIAQPEIKKKKLALHFAPGATPLIEVYPAELNQVFLNLIINAIQATEQGSVDITTRALDKAIEIKVKDAGCGIAQEVIKKIFDPFFTTKPIGTGTGLGLSIAYQIITEQHGGSISVASELGAGTEFTLLLPLKG